MKNINWLNSLGKKAEKEFLACCAAKKWASSKEQKFKDLKQFCPSRRKMVILGRLLFRLPQIPYFPTRKILKKIFQ